MSLTQPSRADELHVYYSIYCTFRLAKMKILPGVSLFQPIEPGKAL